MCSHFPLTRALVNASRRLAGEGVHRGEGDMSGASVRADRKQDPLVLLTPYPWHLAPEVFVHIC